MGNKKSTLANNNEVYVNLNSGLGNQLFMIANAYSYCLEYNKKLKLPKIKSKYWDNILWKCNSFTVTDRVKTDVVFRERNFSFSKIKRVNKSVVFNGFFQSDKYFINHAKEIKELFELSDELKTFSNNQFKKLGIYNNEITVAVHIRRGDYLKHVNKHVTQPITYYKEAKKIMLQKIGYKPKFLYFSDDPLWVRENMELDNRDIIIQGFSDYEDLALMQKCHHFIITNSTFSWWAAWLSESFQSYLNIPNNILMKDIKTNGKIVIAPSNWFGPAGPKNWQDIYPADWVVINSK